MKTNLNWERSSLIANLFLLFCLWSGLIANQNLAQAQDPEFTQFYSNPIYTNPAFAGSGLSCGGRFNLNYRNQWPSLSRTFETYSASFDRHYDNLAGGVGFMVTQDLAGAGMLTTTTANGIYSYEMPVNHELTIRAGVQASYYFKSLDFNKLTFSDMIEPRTGFNLQTQEPLPSTSITFPNFSTGILAYTEKYYAGLAVHNVIEPNQSFYKSTAPGAILPRRYTLHGGMTIPLGGKNNNLKITPSMLLMVQRQFVQTNFGFFLTKSNFMTGLWYRQTRPNSDALMVQVGFRQGPFRVCYSYDLTVSDARVAATGSHEVSLGMDLKCTNQASGLRKTDCYNW
ncbi:MAG: type IX secretion system membrane protein PorP/SprF [Flavobacteriaceae bacterium]|nr:type IX secretion system membrane protein PorP/SprF [Flavobacteriaceae bacterium]